jgi:hypothetical protein
VSDLLNHETASRRLTSQTAYGHATVREAKLDSVFKSERFVWMNVIVGSNRQFRFL